MGLKDIQKEFVKLSLNKEAREDAFDSDSIGSNEFEHLKLAINRHAYSLIRKRLGVVKSILRITRMVMGDAFDEEFKKVIDDNDVPHADTTYDPETFDTYIGMEIGLPRGDDGSVEHATVKRRKLNDGGDPISTESTALLKLSQQTS